MCLGCMSGSLSRAPLMFDVVGQEPVGPTDPIHLLTFAGCTGPADRAVASCATVRYAAGLSGAVYGVIASVLVNHPASINCTNARSWAASRSETAT